MSLLGDRPGAWAWHIGIGMGRVGADLSGVRCQMHVASTYVERGPWSSCHVTSPDAFTGGLSLFPRGSMTRSSSVGRAAGAGGGAHATTPKSWGWVVDDLSSIGRLRPSVSTVLRARYSWVVHPTETRRWRQCVFFSQVRVACWTHA